MQDKSMNERLGDFLRRINICDSLSKNQFGFDLFWREGDCIQMCENVCLNVSEMVVVWTKLRHMRSLNFET